jgi:hypothetical protein
MPFLADTFIHLGSGGSSSSSSITYNSPSKAVEYHPIHLVCWEVASGVIRSFFGATTGREEVS